MTSKILCGLAAVLMTLMIAGCAARQALVMTDARTQYESSLALYNHGKYDDAVLELQKLMFNYPGLSYIDSVDYYLGMAYAGREDYHLGIAEFRHVISSFPSSELIDDAQYMIGKCYFEAAPKAIGLDQSDTENAVKELTAFLEDYPSSDRRNDAELLLSKAIDKMVEKQFRSGRQYYRMGNRVSARLYLEDVVKEYGESRFIPEALFILAKIDQKEEKYADARDKLNNLMNAFPKSEYAGKAAKLKPDLEAKLSTAVQATPDTVKSTVPKSE
jgi:outer membrane protein assembly factor BamD